MIFPCDPLHWQLDKVFCHCLPCDWIFWPHWFVGNQDKKAHDALHTHCTLHEQSMKCRTSSKNMWKVCLFSYQSQNSTILWLPNMTNTIVWEILEVCKGLWAFFSRLTFSDADWLTLIIWSSDHVDVLMAFFVWPAGPGLKAESSDQEWAWLPTVYCPYATKPATPWWVVVVQRLWADWRTVTKGESPHWEIVNVESPHWEIATEVTNNSCSHVIEFWCCLEIWLK